MSLSFATYAKNLPFQINLHLKPGPDTQCRVVYLYRTMVYVNLFSIFNIDLLSLSCIKHQLDYWAPSHSIGYLTYLLQCSLADFFLLYSSVETVYTYVHICIIIVPPIIPARVCIIVESALSGWRPLPFYAKTTTDLCACAILSTPPHVRCQTHVSL